MYMPLYLSILLTTSAIYVPVQLRVDGYGKTVQDNTGNRLTIRASDETAGIGVEFETPFFQLKNEACSTADTDTAKRQVIAGRRGTNFELTADTLGFAGILNVEYILDGKNIKVGSGDAARAGAAAAADIIAWQPWNTADIDNIDVANSKCNPWRVDKPRKGSIPEDLVWDAQVTTPMPLEAVYHLMKIQFGLSKASNILSGGESGQAGNLEGENLVVVTQKYFQSNTNGIDQNKVSDDVLGFCSLVLSYAKAAKYGLSRNQSPKLLTSFMPRTEFNTIFQQVKSKIPGDLFTLFDSLACYKMEGSNCPIEIDEDFCSGSLEKPKSNRKFSRLEFKNADASVKIKSWIQGIGSGTGAKDALSVFDESIDGSLGGLGTTMEKMYNSQRSVPLFEFRGLATPSTTGFEKFMSDVDEGIQDLHKTFAKAP